MKNTSRSWTYLNTALEKNILWSLAITVLPAASSFLTSWIIARGLGPGVLGTVSWVMAFATACLIIAKFGIGIASSRLASEYGVSFPGSLRGLLRSGIELRLVFTVPTVIIVFLCSSVIAGFFGNPSLSVPIRIGSVVILCASIYEFKEHFLVGLNRLAVVYKIRAGYHLVRILFTIIIVAAGWGASYILSGYCAAWLMAITVYLMLLLRFLPESDAKITPGAIRKRLFILSLPLAVSGASVALYSQMDKLMLGYFCEMADVGQYSIARNIVEVSLFPVFAVVMALRPALASRFSAGKLDDCVKIIQKAAFMSLVSGVFFTTVFVMFSKPLIVFVFSERFEEAGMLMLIFAWVIGMRSLGSVILPALIAAEKTKAYAYLDRFFRLLLILYSILSSSVNSKPKERL